MLPDTIEQPGVDIGLVEVVTGIITKPVATMREISSGNGLRLAIPAFLLALLAFNIATVLTDADLVQLFGGRGSAVLVLTAISLFSVPIQSGLCYLLARLYGCSGCYIKLLSLFALANVPLVFAAPLAMVRLVPGAAGSVLHGLGIFALTAWVTVLGVFAVRETFQVPTGRAVIVYLLPLFLVLALVIVFTLVIVLVLAAAM